MPLKKTIRIASIGTPASYHKVRRYAVDVEAKTTFIDIASFYDEQAARDNLQSIGMANVMIAGIPSNGTDAVAFCEAQLAEPVPAAPVDGSDPTIGNPNRYLFADAEIVD
ncbi:hypothetical protein ABH944_002488 [Caballeronia udeis]|uniref:Uncharacterized protein n=1 Tax=Caballeronia udeis TaxID=1232866 RepID=A0A158GAJ6_9BURK|nr:hypothetical protein [Caballeronia udeis]SAL28907.1 hypothetical protein AWB69_02264 [Caballeronia udeis]